MDGGADATIRIGAKDDTATGFNSIAARAKAAAKSAGESFKGVENQAKQALGSLGSLVDAAGKGAIAAAAPAAIAFKAMKFAIGEAWDLYQRGAQQARDAAKSLAETERDVGEAVRAAGEARLKAADSAAASADALLRQLAAAGGDQLINRARDTLGAMPGRSQAEIFGGYVQGRRAGWQDDQIEQALSGASLLADTGRMTWRDALKDAFAYKPAEFQALGTSDAVGSAAAIQRAGAFREWNSPEAVEQRRLALVERQASEDQRYTAIQDEVQRDLGARGSSIDEQRAEIARRYGSAERRTLSDSSQFQVSSFDRFLMEADQQRLNNSQILQQFNARRDIRQDLDGAALDDAIDMGSGQAALDRMRANLDRQAPGSVALIEQMRRLTQERDMVQSRLESNFDRAGYLGPVDLVNGEYSERKELQTTLENLNTKIGQMADAIHSLNRSNALPIGAQAGE